MDDIKRPKPRLTRPGVSGVSSQTTPSEPMLPPPVMPPQPASEPEVQDEPPRPHRSRRLLIIGSLVGIVLLGLMLGLYGYYRTESAPVNPADKSAILFTVPSGSSTTQIGQQLQKAGLIRSASFFDFYVRLKNERNLLQAGEYQFSPDESLATIVSALVKGKVDQFSITFLPGATLVQDEAVLEKAGFSSADVMNALNQPYTDPLFIGKPTGASLEGYLWGDTYTFPLSTSVQTILETAFKEYDQKIATYHLQSAFAAHGLSLYQGIILSSIVQREMTAPSGTTPSLDQREVAQVFYSRLAANMPLGSDVTYIYGASLLGVTPTPTLDSPYNTRINPGLPPGPIATPGITALEAVGNPAPTNYLYFLSGDDGKTYFSTTEAQHEANIQTYCKIKCSQAS